MEVGGRRSPAYLILTLLTYLLKSRQRKILFSVRGKDVRSFHPAAGARLDTATPRYPGMAEDTAPCPRRLPSSCDLSQQANADLRPLNPLIVPMLTDLYNITMAYGHWLHGRADVQATFELYFRKNPFGGEYTVFAGLEECVKFMSSFRFAQEHIQYLRQQPALAGCERRTHLQALF